MYYKTPIYGRAYKPFSNQMVEVKSDAVNQWRFQKLVNWRKGEFAMFINDAGEQIMQSLRSIRFVRCKPGEDNYMAKLTNAQGIEIFQRASKGEDHKVLAKEFGITESYVNDIKNMRARTSITLNFLSGDTKKAVAAKAVVASRNKGKKLSPSLAKFIRNDRVVLKLNVKTLSTKYCVTPRTIQRVLKGDMYKEVPQLKGSND